MLESIIHLDVWLFKVVHLWMQNEIFDVVLPLVRNKWFWVPLYVLFTFLSFKKFGLMGFVPVVFAIMAIAMTDQISAGLIKQATQRLRPCNDPSLQHIIRHLVDCGSGYSFVSAHASNHFAIAVLYTWFFSFDNKIKIFRWIFYAWASLICFAQVYVGVHFPLDVFVGATLGYFIARIFLYLQNRTLTLLLSDEGVSG